MEGMLDGPLPVLEGLGDPVVEFPGSGRRIVTWLGVDELEERVRELRRQLSEAGWDTLGERSILFGLFREIDFERAGRHRAIVVSRAPGMQKLNLVETHADATG